MYAMSSSSSGSNPALWQPSFGSSWGDEEFPNESIEDFGPRSTTGTEFTIGAQPGGGMEGFLIERRAVMSSDIVAKEDTSFYMESANFAVSGSSATASVGNEGENSQGRQWDLPEGENLYQVVPESRKHQRNYRDRDLRDSASSRGAKRKQIVVVEPSISAEGRVSTLAPIPVAVGPSPSKKAKRERIAKENWKPEMLDLNDDELKRLQKSLSEKSRDTVYLLDVDSIREKKITHLVRSLLFSSELPEDMLLIVAKSSYFAPVCNSCSVPFPGKMKEIPQRLLLKKSDQQPVGMTAAEFYAHAIARMTPAFTNLAISVLTCDKKSSFKWTNAIRTAALKPILVDISGEEEKVGDHCPKSMYPPTIIPDINELCIKFGASCKLPEGAEQEFLNTLRRSDSSETRRVSATAYASIAEERSVQSALARVRDWLLSRQYEGSLPGSRAALINSIAKTHCRVKEFGDAQAIISMLFSQGISHICSTCGNLALKRGEEVAQFVPRDKWDANSKYGAEHADTMTRVLHYLESPKASVPSSFGGLRNLIEGLCNRFKLVAAPKVVDRLFSLGLVQEGSSIDMHSAGANAYLNKDKNPIIYDFEKLAGLVLEIDTEMPEEAYEQDDLEDAMEVDGEEPQEEM